MFHKVKSVLPQDNYILLVSFSEGVSKTYDVKPLFKKWKIFNDLKKEEFKLILEFQEHAGSDPNLMINMHMFLTEHDIDVLPEVNDEILDYKWFNIGDDESILCDSIKLHLLPYLKNKTTI